VVLHDRSLTQLRRGVRGTRINCSRLTEWGAKVEKFGEALLALCAGEPES